MKYLTKQELQLLSDADLDKYAGIVTECQTKILDLMDLWVDAYNITSDEYDRRKPTSKSIVFKNDSETVH